MSDELIEGRLHRLDLGFVNAYLVDDGEVTLVDAGISRSVGTLRAELTQAGYDAGALAVYLHDELPVALLGDLVREDDGRLERPPWFINYDTGQVVESIRALASLEPAFDVAAMGHGEPLVDAGDAALQELASRLR